MRVADKLESPFPWSRRSRSIGWPGQPTGNRPTPGRCTESPARSSPHCTHFCSDRNSGRRNGKDSSDPRRRARRCNRCTRKSGSSAKPSIPWSSHAPTSSLNVEQQGRREIARVLKPDPARSLPDIHPTVVLKSYSNGIGPRSRDDAFSKPGRHRCGREITLKAKNTCQDRNQCHRGRPQLHKTSSARPREVTCAD